MIRCLCHPWWAYTCQEKVELLAAPIHKKSVTHPAGPNTNSGHQNSHGWQVGSQLTHINAENLPACVAVLAVDPSRMLGAL
jgi:hypothetical protein